MGQIYDGSVGATETCESGSGILRPTGWRKATAANLHTKALADAGQGTQTSRTRAIVAVKRVAAAIGLKASDLLLLDTLMAFSQPQDWGQGRRALVWPSNAYLMERTGFSLSTLKRHSRRLAEAGIIAFHDSPNGKRWGHRDARGHIIEAYGIELTPLAARVAEFEALETQLAEERALSQRLKRKITILRRSIRARLVAMGQQAAGDLWEAYEQLVIGQGARSIDALQTQTDQLQSLLMRLEDQNFSEFKETAYGEPTPLETDLDSLGARNDPHIQTTDQPNLVSINRSGGHDIDLQQANTQGETQENCIEETQGGSGSSKPTPTYDLKALRQACPEFTNWVGMMGRDSGNWSSLRAATDQLRPMIGIPDVVWQDTGSALDTKTLVASFALVFEKAQAGELTSPAGYLRGMLRKARAGTLHVDRSLLGRAWAQKQVCA